MILKYFGIHAELKNLTKNMLRDGVIDGTYIYENGSLLLLQNLKVTLITANPILFERESWTSMKNDQDFKKHLQNFKKRKPAKKGAIKLLEEFVEKGGVVKVELPTINHIKNAIDHGKIVMASIYGRALGSKEGGFHYVVVSGHKEGQIYINNPLPGSKTGWFKNEDFVHALLASSCFDVDNGALLIVG